MQYIKRLLSFSFFGPSENKENNLRNYKKVQEAPIGRGTFGFVYKVQKDNEYYAAKVLRQSTIDKKSYIKELENQIGIQHPAIMPLEEYSLTDFSHEPNTVLITKYSVNGSLNDALNLEQKDLSIDNLDNKKGYIHCDLKPQNILLNKFFFPQISDFGLLRLYNSDELISLLNNETFSYVAPEFLNGEKFDSSVDVFSYGLIMYEIVTGEKLYQKNTSPFDIQLNVEKGYKPQFPRCEINQKK